MLALTRDSQEPKRLHSKVSLDLVGFVTINFEDVDLDHFHSTHPLAPIFASAYPYNVPIANGHPNARIAIEQVALVTGHKDWKMLCRYTHIRPEALHRLAASRAPFPSGNLAAE
ncbi:hypothetical protein [Palleronia pontilimi]|uniref:hypothetical protein n=1 Tax=Palleronia pontilimi TaxID=1964209 RepID=UPI001F323913|nr:hypothetical protein [Palleronia pontilimi]